MSDQPQPPSGWVIAPLEQVVGIHDRIRVPLNAKQRSSRPGPYPYFGANGQVDSIDDYLFDGTFVLIAEDGGHFHEPSRGVAYTASGKFWVNNHAHVVSTMDAMPAEFLTAQLNATDWRPYVGGSTRLKLTQKDMKRVPLCIPPLNEQRRIVAKLDALQAHSRDAREALDAIPALLDRFRQSVLAAAFRGDLTREWRENNPDVEPASVLLERIRAERRVRWIAAEAEKARARAEARAQKKGQPWGPEEDEKALVAGRKKAEKKYTEPEPVDAEAEGLPELPEGWCWAEAEWLTPGDRSIMYGIIKAGPHDPAGVPMIRVMDITAPGPLSIENLKRCNPERASKFARATLQTGDLVVSKDGTIGRVEIVPPELDGANITQHVLRVSPGRHILNTWFAYALRSPHAQAWMKGETKGVALQGVNVGDFRRLPVPVPPRGEQTAIASVLDERMLVIDEIHDRWSESCGKLGTLDQAILAKAFRGELVPQDPNDEPASVLLERIRAERKAASKKPKAKR